MRLYSLSSSGAPVLQRTLSDAAKWIVSVSFSADNCWLATGSGDDKVRLYNLSSSSGPALPLTAAVSINAIFAMLFTSYLALGTPAEAGGGREGRGRDGGRNHCACTRLAAHPK